MFFSQENVQELPLGIRYSRAFCSGGTVSQRPRFTSLLALSSHSPIWALHSRSPQPKVHGLYTFRVPCCQFQNILFGKELRPRVSMFSVGSQRTHVPIYSLIVSASPCCIIWFESQPCTGQWDQRTMGTQRWPVIDGLPPVYTQSYSLAEPSTIQSCCSWDTYRWGFGLFHSSVMALSMPGISLDCFVGFDYAISRGQMYVCGLIILPHGAWKQLVYRNLNGWFVSTVLNE